MVLRKYLGELTRCLSSQDQLLSVAIHLYAKGLISEEVKDMVITGKDENYLKAAKLLSAIEKQVKTSNALAGFLEVLKTNEIGLPLVDKIISDENLHVTADGNIVHQHSLVRQGSSQDSGYDPTEYQHPNQLDMLLTSPPPVANPPRRHRSSSFPSTAPAGSQQPASHTHPLLVEHHLHGVPVTTASQQQNSSPPHGGTTAQLTSTTPNSGQPYHFQQSTATPNVLPSPHGSIQAAASTTPNNGQLYYLQQPAATPSASPSNLQLMCEVQDASTGATITGTSHTTVNTTVYRDVTIRKKRCRVPSYTPLCLRVQANQRCYVYIINIGSSGNVTTLVPNQDEPRHLVEPGATLEFPSKEADYDFELDGQSGEEILVLLAYSTPCEIHQAEKDCCKMRARENTTVYRDVTIRRKCQAEAPSTACDKELSNPPLGFLEVQFNHR